MAGKAWKLRRIGEFLTESRLPGSDGSRARKISVKLYGCGVVPKHEPRLGSSNTKYYQRRAGQFIYSKLDFLNGAFGIIPPELDGYESTLDLPTFDVGRDIDPNWFLYYIGREEFYKTHIGLAKGGRKARRISPEEFLAIEIPVPPIAEQRRTVEVLQSVDTTIRSTKAVIEQTRRVKQGLLGELLTRGIGHTRFKPTEIGAVPEGWDVKPLCDLLIDPPRNGLYKGPGDIGKGTIVVGQLATTDNDTVDFGRTRRARIEKAELETFGLSTDDVLVTRVFATAKGVGRSILVPVLPEPAVYESNMMRLRTKADILSPKFLFLWLKVPQIRLLIESTANKSQQASINQTSLASLPCVVPTLIEQHQVIEVLDAFDRSSLAAQKMIETLPVFRDGLMTDLFRGIA